MRRIDFVTLSLALSLAASCGGTGPGSSPVPPPGTGAEGEGRPAKVVVLMCDLSQSTRGAQVRERYRKAFAAIVASLRDRDVIVADAINDNPLAKSDFPVKAEFPEFVPGTDNELMVRKKRQAFDADLETRRTAVIKDADGLLEAPAEGVRQTHILDSLVVASRVFNSYDRERKILVLFSDMVEESSQANFATTKADAALAKRLVAKAREANRLPSLDGVRVYVVGASAPDAAPDAADRFLRVKEFWVEYFAGTGAELTDMRYGSSLLKFDE